MNILQENTYDQDHIRFDNGEYRITGLSDNAIKFVDRVIGQLGDGIWENSRAMEYYWPYISTDGNDIIIKGWNHFYDSRGKYCKFADMNEQHIKEWLANKIKAAVKEEINDNPRIGLWKRDNDAELDYLDGTLSQAYAAYDELKGRKNKDYGQSYNKPAFLVCDIDIKQTYNTSDPDQAKLIIQKITSQGHKGWIKNNTTGQIVEIK